MGDNPIREALLKAEEALDVWLATDASDLVSDDMLRQARAVIYAGGGTLAYIAEAQRMIRFALSEPAAASEEEADG